MLTFTSQKFLEDITNIAQALTHKQPTSNSLFLPWTRITAFPLYGEDDRNSRASDAST